jgi:hypothetical protein
VAVPILLQGLTCWKVQRKQEEEVAAAAAEADGCGKQIKTDSLYDQELVSMNGVWNSCSQKEAASKALKSLYFHTVTDMLDSSLVD